MRARSEGCVSGAPLKTVHVNVLLKLDLDVPVKAPTIEAGIEIVRGMTTQNIVASPTDILASEREVSGAWKE